MNKGYFITGTDTGIGKTIVTAAITAVLHAEGIKVLPVKPVETGCRAPAPRPTPDIEKCLRLTGITVPPDALPHLNTYRFVPACSPHLAAARIGATIRLQPVMKDFRRLQSTADMLIVEGAGGVMVPLSDRLCMLDLMKALALPVILVSRPDLGAINHAVMSLEILRQAGLTVAGLVFNRTKPTRMGYIENDNIRFIPRRGKARLLGVIPYIPCISGTDKTPTAGKIQTDFLHTVRKSLPPAVNLARGPE